MRNNWLDYCSCDKYSFELVHPERPNLDIVTCFLKYHVGLTCASCAAVES